MLDHAALAARLPHAGRMCLLDRVLRWDDRNICCVAISHRDIDNPLRDVGGLPALAGVEYAAQAAALHGALLNDDAVPRSGVLGALKNVTIGRPWLHDVTEEIVVETTLLYSDPAGCIFTFAVFAGEDRLLSGQFTLMYLNESKETSA